MIEALVYVAGALLVFAGAFMPIAARVYGPRTPAQQIAAVEAAPTAWRWHHILMGAGAAATAAAGFWEALGSGNSALVGAAIGFVLGAAFFLHFLQARLFMPPTAWFKGSIGSRRFAAFTVLTTLALVLRGVAAVHQGTLEGALLAGYGALLLGLFLLLRDMPPFAHYLGTLGLGIALLP